MKWVDEIEQNFADRIGVTRADISALIKAVRVMEEVVKQYSSLPPTGREVQLGNGTTTRGLPLGYRPQQAVRALKEVENIRKVSE